MDTKLRELFQGTFNHEKYRKLVIEGLLHCKQAFKQPELLDDDANGDVIYGLGRTTDIDGKEIGFYYTKVSNSDVTRKRVGFHKMMQPYVKYGVDAAIAVFDDGVHWRLSYISDLKGGATSAKRFSYVVGDPAGHYNTPSHRLAQLGTLASHLRLSDIYEAFSVEALSKEFFDGYHQHYDRILKVLADSITDPGKDAISNTANKNIANFFADYVKKMMGRIVFLHFLQKKGWLNGNQDFLQDLFLKQSSDRRADFLERVLEPLFFGIFNTEVANREKVFRDNGWDLDLLEQWKALPYLNGGLFERDGHDMATLKLPASLFEDLFSFMASYNFTVDENDPDDAEVGVDPEMLGKIFESLLEDNKAKGAFYTPKEIVRYMCKESLIAYLSSKTAKSGNNLQDFQDLASETSGSIRTFVETHEMQPELEPFRDTLDKALREVKICDPAIGSGAFPMGLLNELWRCREAIEETSSRAELKKEIIENNIYGVDIERGAIDIARLRFWLSIVVDAQHPEPLPNFDYKFMQGNSLIESYDGFDLSRISAKLRGGQSKSMQLILGIDTHSSRQNLQRLLREYFSVTDHKQKDSMRQAINDEVKTLIRESIGGTSDSLKRLANMDPSANQDFFLWHTWFKDIFDNGGFDIVIGNPPYINVKNGIEDDVKKIYKETYKTAIGQFDLFTLFIEKGLDLSKEGILSLIVPKPIINNENYTIARQLLLKRGLTNIIIGSNIFENAGVESCIIIAKDATSYLVSEVDGHRNIVNKYSIPLKVASGLPFSMISTELSKEKLSIINKIQNTKHNLFGEIIDVTRGIEGGKSDSCITLTPNEYKLIRGQDCTKYSIIPSNLYCIYDNKNTSKFKPLRLYFDTKLLIRRVSNELISTVDYDNYLCLNTVYCGKIVNNNYKYTYVCAILNSSLISFWFRNIFVLTDKLFPYIRKSQLDFVPIAVVSPEEQDRIEKIVNQILSKKHITPTADTSALEHEIDKQVYAIYNLTPEEIAIIEQ